MYEMSALPRHSCSLGTVRLPIIVASHQVSKGRVPYKRDAAKLSLAAPYPRDTA